MVDKDENTVRGNWSNKLDFLLSLIGYTVGFGNVWRFPYLCYRNGGGVFLIPYFLTLAFAGIPLYFLEIAMGQYASLGPVGVWNMSPFFKGLGIAAVGMTGIVNIYYTTLLTYVIFYLFASMTSELPWATCGNPWNTPACSVMGGSQADVNSSGTGNFTETITQFTSTVASTFERNLTLYNTTLKPAAPAEEYFERYVLELSPGIDQLGSFRWQLVLCNILAWIIAYLCLIKGIKSTGKVVYFTATFPYIVLFILLIRGLTLPGAFNGLYYYLVPDWSKILDHKVWGDAAAQIFYSLGPTWGCLFAFSSYNRFHNNCHRDAVFASMVGCFTSLFAGTVIFSVIGFLAHDLNVDVSDVIASGPGLAFVAYPAALARMPIAPFWSILFFLMLITAGLDTLFAQVEVVVVSLTDQFRNTLRPRKALFTLAVIIFYFLLGLPQLTQGGIYILTLIDWYVALFSVMIIAFLESVSVVYVYGYNNLARDMQVMLGFKPNIFYRICWSALTPCVVSCVAVFNVIMHSPATYGPYVFPPSAVNIGWVISLVPVLTIPGYMIYHTATHFGSCQNFMRAIRPPYTGATLRALTRPAPNWGPMMPQHRREAGIDIGELEQDQVKASEGLITSKTDSVNEKNSNLV